MRGDNISTVGDNISTVEGILYSGGRILISTCLVINNDEKISTFLYYDTKFSFGNFSKIQADFMHFESWTGVLQVEIIYNFIFGVLYLSFKFKNNFKPCFEIIYNFIFGVLYLSFKFKNNFKPCFEIIYNFIFGVLYLSFKFNCLCDCT